MIILKKSKYSDPLCPHCIYKDECKLYHKSKDEYHIIACSMSGPQDDFPEDFLKKEVKNANSN